MRSRLIGRALDALRILERASVRNHLYFGHLEIILLPGHRGFGSRPLIPRRRVRRGGFIQETANVVSAFLTQDASF